MKFSSIRSILVCACAILPLVTAHSELIVSMAESTLVEIAEAENANREAMVERQEKVPVTAFEEVEIMNTNGNKKKNLNRRRVQIGKGGRPAGGIRQNGGDPRFNNYSNGRGEFNNGRGGLNRFEDDPVFGGRVNDDRLIDDRLIDDDEFRDNNRIDDRLDDDEFRNRNDDRFEDDRRRNVCIDNGDCSREERCIDDRCILNRARTDRNDRFDVLYARPLAAPLRNRGGGRGGNPVRNQRAREHFQAAQNINGLQLRSNNNNRRRAFDDLFD